MCSLRNKGWENKIHFLGFFTMKTNQQTGCFLHSLCSAGHGQEGKFQRRKNIFALI